MAFSSSSGRFATMLHKSSTPKIAIVLIYTLLEWTLIALMLLDGLFSYSIAAFAEFFGLHPPCFLCSRALATSSSSSYQQILCDSHLHELGFTNLHKEEVVQGFRSLLCEKSEEKLVFGEKLLLDGNNGENLHPDEKSDGFFVFGEKLEEKLLIGGKSEEKLVFGEKLLLDGNSEENLHLDEKSDGFFVFGEKLEENLLIGGKEEKLVLDEKSDEKLEENLVPGEKSEEKMHLHENLIFDEILEEKSILDEKSEAFFVLGEKLDEILVLDEKSEEKLVLDENALENLHPAEKSEEELVLGDKDEENLNLNEEDDLDDASLELIIGMRSEEVEERLIPVDLVDSSTLLAADNGGEFNGNDAVDAEANCEVSIGSEICDQDEHIDLPIALLRSSEQVTTEFTAFEAEPADERAPETPTSVDSFHALQKRLRELWTESLDGSEIDGGELLTIDQLKSALKAERNALTALYAELEEERNASSVAANQTMAMITRLQEEKAAMQMEAFQYQRMMEEQSEYDQEALQLLNDLVVKREREKRELEEELEAYRKETRASSAMSNANERSDNGRNLRFATDSHLLTLDDSLDDFEEERSAVLEQLKALEDKLLSLDDEHENGHGLNGFGNDKPRSAPRGGKRLQLLFDAVVSTENGDAIRNHKKLAIAEEVESVYERLHALEEDREFIKQCIGSLKKGDKGMDLLQEILQHLRELRSVQLRVRNAGYALASLSA